MARIILRSAVDGTQIQFGMIIEDHAINDDSFRSYFQDASFINFSIKRFNFVWITWKEASLKETVAEAFSLMPEVSFSSTLGVEVDDSIEGSKVSSLDATETLIEWDVDEVCDFMSCEEEVDFLLCSRMKGSNSTLRLDSWNFNSRWESSSSKLALLTDSRSEVATKIWFSKISGSKLILSLDKKQVRSSFD